MVLQIYELERKNEKLYTSCCGCVGIGETNYSRVEVWFMNTNRGKWARVDYNCRWFCRTADVKRIYSSFRLSN